MSELVHRFVETNGIRMHVAEQGSGPLVLLLHGFPESWYSWRHQLPALAAAGYRAVAPDQRGYGQTDRPDQAEQYTIMHLIGDAVGLLDALGAEQAVVVGHDFGAPLAWHAALLRPDRFRAVVGLSVPYWPRRPARPSAAWPETEEAVFYQRYFQAPGVAEAELGRDVRGTLRRLLSAASGDAPAGAWSIAPDGAVGMVPRRGGFLDGMPDPPALPPWLTEADVEFYAGEFGRTGFGGGLTWYRNIDRGWELLAPFAGARVGVPALYVVGERDFTVGFRGMDQVIRNLDRFAPQLRRTVLLPGCGHWTQQERPGEVNAAMIEFVQGLPVG
jgi:pimeloyl-ACP methyl ester carboxylesterase